MPVYKPPMHGRDHCPGGSDPIPCFPSAFWAILRDGTTTVPNLSTTFPVPFTLAYKYDPNDLYFSWTTTDSGDTGNTRFVLTLKKQGLYHLDCAVSWNDTGTGNGTAKLDVKPSNSYNPEGTGEERNYFQIGSDWVTTSGSGDIQASAVQRVSGMISANTNCQLTPFVAQTTGASRQLDGIYLKIVWIASHDGYTFATA